MVIKNSKKAVAARLEDGALAVLGEHFGAPGTGARWWLEWLATRLPQEQRRVLAMFSDAELVGVLSIHSAHVPDSRTAGTLSLQARMSEAEKIDHPSAIGYNPEQLSKKIVQLPNFDAAVLIAWSYGYWHSITMNEGDPDMEAYIQKGRTA